MSVWVCSAKLLASNAEGELAAAAAAAAPAPLSDGPTRLQLAHQGSRTSTNLKLARTWGSTFFRSEAGRLDACDPPFVLVCFVYFILFYPGLEFFPLLIDDI